MFQDLTKLSTFAQPSSLCLPSMYTALPPSPEGLKAAASLVPPKKPPKKKAKSKPTSDLKVMKKPGRKASKFTKSGRRRQCRDPDAPKRARTSFNFFLMDFRVKYLVSAPLSFVRVGGLG